MLIIGCAIVLSIIVIVCIRAVNAYAEKNKQEKNARAKEETKDLAWISGTTLYLEKRDPKMRNAISIEEFMGKDEGKLQKSGAFKHMYYAGSQVFDIELTEELFNQAQGSYIEKYLNGNTIEVMNRSLPKSIASLKVPMPFGASDIDWIEWEGKVSSIIGDYSLYSGRTYEECFEILSWICGQDDKPTVTN